MNLIGALCFPKDVVFSLYHEIFITRHCSYIYQLSHGLLLFLPFFLEQILESILIEVLSVVAQQLLILRNGMKSGKERIDFEGRNIQVRSL